MSKSEAVVIESIEVRELLRFLFSFDILNKLSLLQRKHSKYMYAKCLNFPCFITYLAACMHALCMFYLYVSLGFVHQLHFFCCLAISQSRTHQAPKKSFCEDKPSAMQVPIFIDHKVFLIDILGITQQDKVEEFKSSCDSLDREMKRLIRTTPYYRVVSFSGIYSALPQLLHIPGRLFDSLDYCLIIKLKFVLCSVFFAFSIASYVFFS